MAAEAVVYKRQIEDALTFFLVFPVLTVASLRVGIKCNSTVTP